MDQHLVHTLLAAIPPKDRDEYVACYGMMCRLREQWAEVRDMICTHNPIPWCPLKQQLEDCVFLAGQLEFVRRVRLHQDDCHINSVSDELDRENDLISNYEQTINNLSISHQKYKWYVRQTMKLKWQHFKTMCLFVFLWNSYEDETYERDSDRVIEILFDYILEGEHWYRKVCDATTEPL